jgi:hypothetical protein
MSASDPRSSGDAETALSEGEAFVMDCERRRTTGPERLCHRQSIAYLDVPLIARSFESSAPQKPPRAVSRILSTAELRLWFGTNRLKNGTLRVAGHFLRRRIDYRRIEPELIENHLSSSDCIC